MKGDKDCQRHRSPWSSSSALTCFVFKPSRCWTERFSLVQSRVMPSLACVLWWGCQSMTAPLADHNKVVIDLASPRISVEAPLEAKGSPMWGLGFTLWPSKHSLWAGKKHFTLQMGLGRVIRFLQGRLGISRWLEVSTLFISVPWIESPRRTQSWERSGDAVTGGEPSLCWTIQTQISPLPQKVLLWHGTHIDCFIPLPVTPFISYTNLFFGISVATTPVLL